MGRKEVFFFKPNESNSVKPLNNQKLTLRFSHTDFRAMFKKSRKIRPLQELSDEELMQHFRKTEQKSYVGELYRRYAHLAFGACRKYLKSTEDCQDMVMIVFEKVLKLLPSTEVRSFKSWLFIVVRNECISSIRKNKSVSNKKTLWETEEKNKDNIVEIDADLRLNDEEQESKELALKKAIASLPPDQQICIRLFYFENKSYQGIHETTHIPLKQVKSNLQNAKRKLKRILSQ